MAEYYPLLDRAVSGLTEPTVEARRSIYERARTALIGQLRRMDPPVPEEDIARESAALDEAVARVEARFGDHGQAAPPPAAPGGAGADGPTRAVDPPGPETPAPGEASSARAATALATPRAPPPPLPTGAPPVVPPPSRERPVLGPRPPSGAVRPAAPAVAAPRPAVPPARAPAPPRGTRPVMALRPAIPAGQAAVEPPGEAPDPGPPGAGAPSPADAEASGAAASFADALDEAGHAGRGAADDVSPGPRPRDGAMRPLAPRPREARDWGRPVIAAACLAVALVMAGIGFAAYSLRERPEQVVAARAAAAGDAGADASSGKVADRAAPAGADGDGEAPASGASVPAPVRQGTDAGAGGPAIAVAQRAALLVDAPDDPQRVKTYVGSVVWHLDSVNPGGGQPLATAVKADIDVPEAKLKVTMLMQKNPEPQLPASHTIELHFLPQPGNTLGAVKQINVPEMRRDDDAPTGDPLAGVPVAITDNYFLVGLSRGAAENQNNRLLAERNWFDMSVLFTSGKLGKLTFEKGAAGQRVIEDALKAWK